MKLSELKLLPTMKLIATVNTLLEELNKRKHYILDWENPDMYLNHLEYHTAASVHEEAIGDGSDNVYCFFEKVKENDEI